MDASAPAVAAPAKPSAAATPMMAQYLEIKERAGDALLFYRMGDFYELFFDDAVTAAAALDITLSRRGRYGDEEVPMCGVPWHSHESYLARLIKQGFKVAICEQTEDPAEARKRGAKSVVARDIVRIVTPGTLTEDILLNAGQNNFLGALAVPRGGAQAALAWADVSTGELGVRETSSQSLGADIAGLSLSELIAPETQALSGAWREAIAGAASDLVLTEQPAACFGASAGERRLKETFAVASLDAFGDFSRGDCAALGALLGYVDLTQVGKRPALRAPRRTGSRAAMAIDAATRASLEILKTQSGEKAGSLFGAVDRTVTGPGARTLASRLSAPLTDAAAVNARLDAVGCFEDAGLRDEARDILKSAPDMARALSRLALERGGPRDLIAVRDGLKKARALARVLSAPNRLSPPPALAAAIDALEAKSGEGFSALIQDLADALQPDAPLLARDGGFVARGYDAGLDSIRVLRDDSRRLIAGLEARYRRDAGLKALKIKHNNVLGFFVETPAAHGDKLMAPPLAETFIHRQTLASAVRFTTGELADLDAKIARARDEALARELEIFDALVARARAREADIAAAADAMAEIDVAAALAALAAEERYVRPVVDATRRFEVSGGRHPVVEQAVRKAGGAFIANDCVLSEEDDGGLLWLVTGPNMAGKSTFLRQNALIAILAQAGCYVPAASARIGVADRVFSRVGAADDLARGRSTFMVEMVETAAILNQATDRSLVILDEIGRGTATFDGVSIAWACVEHLHDQNRCRGLFATHYHELTALSQTLARLRNVSMRVREWKGEVVFLHEVAEGAADRSYGVAVARLAGLPASVVRRAGAVLADLEASGRAGAEHASLPLFAAAPSSNAGETGLGGDAVADALAGLDPDAMTPRQALEALYHLKTINETL